MLSDYELRVLAALEAQFRPSRARGAASRLRRLATGAAVLLAACVAAVIAAGAVIGMDAVLAGVA